MTIQPQIDAATYERERALVDAADTVFRRRAPDVWRKGGTIPESVTSSPERQAVDNAMRGRVEQFDILTNPPAALVVYVGDRVEGNPSRRWLTTWTGDRVGTCYLGSGWRVNSFVGDRMYQAHARIAGRDYTGRTFGDGMSVVLRETAESKRRRGA